DPLPLKPWPAVEADEVARQGLRRPRFDTAGGKNFPFTRALINKLAETIVEADQSPVDTLLLFSANPAHTLPDGGLFRKALKKVPFVVSFSPYKDESSLMADLVLPDHSYLEKMEDIVWPIGLQYPLYGIANPVVEPLYNTRQSGEVIIALSKMIGGAIASSFPWKSYQEAIKDRAKGLFETDRGLTTYDDAIPPWKRLPDRSSAQTDYDSFDDMWKKMSASGLWYRPVRQSGNLGTVFKTPTGKFEFSSSEIELAVNNSAKEGALPSTLKDMGISAEGDEVYLPHYEETSHSVNREKYPLLLVPYALINLSSGWVPSPPYLYKTLFDNQLQRHEVFADIHPDTASEHGLKSGDSMIIESPAGKIKARVNIFEGAMPGALYLPLGLGHTAYDDFQQNKGANPNEIIDPGKDPLSGLPVWWRTHVRILKA
ncbi:MAG: molybdopterin dinucleotide binding domain-containing protein, partial [Pseudomonadota bacterium]